MLILKKFDGTSPIGNPIIAETATELTDLKIDTVIAGGYVFYNIIEAPRNSDILKEYVEGDPLNLGNNTWSTNWVLQNKVFTNNELENTQATILADKWNALRAQRDYQISRTDWYSNSDVTMPTNIATYRQALRDITEGLTNPDDVVWPVDQLNLP